MNWYVLIDRVCFDLLIVCGYQTHAFTGGLDYILSEFNHDSVLHSR
jgi:hypothetical protein